jgi:uncharacterized protein (UPF0147 family)
MISQEETIFAPIIEALKELQKDGIPKSVSTKLEEVISVLSTSDEPFLAISRALSTLESVTDSSTLASDTRMELLRTASMLESF